MERPFPSPSAGFDNPLEMLEACHQRVRQTCALVERIAEHIEDEGIDEEVRTAVASALRYFDVAGRDHHRDEEEDLFPAMLEAASPGRRVGVEAVVERLQADHQALDALWADLRARLEAVVNGSASSLDRACARAFTSAYADHIAEEERLLLPLARRLLPPAAIARLGASMAARRGVKKT